MMALIHSMGGLIRADCLTEGVEEAKEPGVCICRYEDDCNHVAVFLVNSFQS